MRDACCLAEDEVQIRHSNSLSRAGSRLYAGPGLEELQTARAGLHYESCCRNRPIAISHLSSDPDLQLYSYICAIHTLTHGSRHTLETACSSDFTFGGDKATLQACALLEHRQSDTELY